MKNLYIILLALLTLSSINVYAQKNIIRGDAYYYRDMYDEAISFYKKELKNKDIEIRKIASLKLANCYKQTGLFFEAEELYSDLRRRYGRREPIYIFEYANALRSSSKYAEAITVFEEYKSLVPDDKLADIYIISCQLAEEWLIDPGNYEVKNIFRFNTSSTDATPAYYNRDTLVFCSSRDGSTKKFIDFSGVGSANLLDFFYVNIYDETHIPSNEKFFNNLNTPMHEGPADFSADGKEIYFTRTIRGNKDKETKTISSTLQIFYSKRNENGNWETPVSAFPFNSIEYSVAHPSLSDNGQSLYFASDMPGGYGGFDIYVIKKNPDGTWGNYQNLGPIINTFGNEISPHIHSDTLIYFTSDTHPGMGKKDIFKAFYINGKWDKVTNLKPPINSLANDFGLVREKGTNRGFFTSDRFNGLGLEDIYSFVKKENLNLCLDMNIFKFQDNTFFNDASYRLDEKESRSQLTEIESNNLEKVLQFTLPSNTEAILIERKGMVSNRIELKANVNTSISSTNHFEAHIKPLMANVNFDGYIKKESENNYSDSITNKISFTVANASVKLWENDVFIKDVKSDNNGYFCFNNDFIVGNEYKIIASGGQIMQEMYNAKIVDINNNPLQSVVINLFNDKNEKVGTTLSNSNGDFSYRLSQSNDFIIYMQKNDYVTLNYSLIRNVAKSFRDNEKIHILKSLDTIPPVDISPKTEIIVDKPSTIICKGIVSNENISVSNATIYFITGFNDTIINVLSDRKGNYQTEIPLEQQFRVVAVKENKSTNIVDVSTINKNADEALIVNLEFPKIIEETPKVAVASEEFIYRIQIISGFNLVDPQLVEERMNIKESISIYKDKDRFRYTIKDFDSFDEAKEYRDNNDYSSSHIVAFPKKLKPIVFERTENKVKISGTIYDETLEPTKADIEFAEIETNKIEAKTSSDENTGYYEAQLSSGKTYGMTVTKDDYLFHSDKINLEKIAGDIKKDIKIQPIDTGSSIVLHNIFFDYGKAVIRTSSYPELDRIVKLMKDNSTIEVEVSGHTCNISSYEFNKKLSEERAKSIARYIINKGISQSRISSKGYAFEKPIASNNTEEGKEQNRRAELKILKK